MDPAHSVRGLYKAPCRPQGVPVHLLGPQVLGQLGGEASVHKVDLAGFERRVDIGIHVNENTKTSQGVQQEHMLVLTEQTKAKEDCRDTQLSLENKVVAVEAT